MKRNYLLEESAGLFCPILNIFQISPKIWIKIANTKYYERHPVAAELIHVSRRQTDGHEELNGAFHEYV